MLRLAVRFFWHGFSAPMNANTAALTAPTVSRHPPPGRVFELCAANRPCTKAKSKQPEIQRVRAEMCCRQRSSDQLSLLMRVFFSNGDFFCRSTNLFTFPINIHTAKRFTIGIRQRYQPVLVFAAPILVVARNSAVEHDALPAAEPW